MVKKFILVGKIILVVAFIFTLAGCSKENKVSSMAEIDDVAISMDEMGSDQQVDELIQKALFSYELDKSYNLYVVNDGIHTEYENVLILKKTNDKFKKVEEFGFNPYGNDIEGNDIYQISKIAVQKSKQNDVVYVYVFREGQLYKGVDILILSNEKVDKKWIYRNKQTPNLMFGHLEYEYLLNQQKTYIYDGKEKKHQNTKQDLKEKEELINKFTQKLKNIENRKVLYGDFLDDDQYVYVVTDQIDEQKEKIMIVHLNDGNVERLFEGGDSDGDDQPIGQIHKMFINRLNNSVNPNVCVFRKNEKYTKVQIIEVDKKKKAICYKGNCTQNNETGEFSGDESYKHLLDSSLPSDYCSHLEEDQ